MHKKIAGIYRIINKINQKIYIGSSQDIDERFKQHKRELNNNKHVNNYLQKAWNKYGEENFIFEILEITEIQNLLVLEQKYIDLHKPYDKKCGYNIATNAFAPMRGRKHSKESIEKQVLNQSGKNHWSYGKPKFIREKISIAKGGLSLEKQKEVVELIIKSTEDIETILKKFNISKTTYYRILKRHNIKFRRKIYKIDDNLIDLIKKEYINGMTRAEIRKKYKLKKTTVYKITKNLT